jgi:hypothetical protein
MDSQQEIGEVWASRNWRTGEYRYAFDNHRLRAKRSRGSCTETKDMKKALKLILENMYARTLSELMDTTRKSATSKTNTAIYAIQRDFRIMRGKADT